MSAGPCRYWQAKGSCFYGANCRFSHDGPVADPIPPNPNATTTSTTTTTTSATPTTTATTNTAAAATTTADSSSLAQSLNTLSVTSPSASGTTSTLKFKEFVPKSTTSAPVVQHPQTSTTTETKTASNPYTQQFIPQQQHLQHHHQPQPHLQHHHHHIPQHHAHGMGMGMLGGVPHKRGTHMQVVPNSVRNRQPQNLYPVRRTIPSFFMDDNIRQELNRENQLIVTRIKPDDPKYHEVPLSLRKDRYHSLWPLPFDIQNKASTFPSKMYKVTSSENGMTFALRRVIGCRLSAEATLATLKPWVALGMNHAHIVGIRDVFSTTEFNDGGSLCLVSDYYPGAVSLESQYFSTQDPRAIPEEVLWTYICQIVSALASIHALGLACRVVVPKRILVTQRHRLRLNWCGIGDVLGTQSQQPIDQLQYEDLLALGRVILTLACQRRDAHKNVRQSIAYVEAHYSPDLKELIAWLMSKPDHNRIPTVFNVASLISHRLVGDLQLAYSHSDALWNELAKETQNGRLFRLLVKLGFITERPEFGSDPNWAENEERYIIKLFRDFVFHTVHEDGTPHLNFAHVVQSLNKLDAGSQEKTLLVSRSEDSMLIVTYADVKNCINQAFQQLLTASKKKQFQ